MASDKNQDSSSRGRTTSFTQRLVGQGKDWMSGFYSSADKDDQSHGNGFSDPVDDFVPGTFSFNRRNRTVSTSSTESDVSTFGQSRSRAASLSERVSGFGTPFSRFRSNSISSAVSDMDDFSVLF